MKRLLKWGVVVFIGLLVLGWLVERFESPEDRQARVAAGLQREAAKALVAQEQAQQEAAQMPTVTPSDLVTAYEANTVAADQRFKGRKFKVTGIVSDINTDFAGNPYLVLRASGNPFMLPQFSFDDAANEQLAKVRKGTKVTLVCVGRGDVGKVPMAGKCALI